MEWAGRIDALLDACAVRTFARPRVVSPSRQPTRASVSGSDPTGHAIQKGRARHPEVTDPACSHDDRADNFPARSPRSKALRIGDVHASRSGSPLENACTLDVHLPYTHRFIPLNGFAEQLFHSLNSSLVGRKLDPHKRLVDRSGKQIPDVLIHHEDEHALPRLGADVGVHGEDRAVDFGFH